MIFARITPSMQNGKSAIFDGENEFGYSSTEFHVLRPGPEITAEWLHRVVRTKEFRDMAALRFKGTAGQQRVPTDFLRIVEIPVPTIQEQLEAVAVVDHLTDVASRVAKERRRVADLVSALQPAALNETFTASADH